MPAELGDAFRASVWIAEIIEEEVPELRAVQASFLEALRPLTIAVHEQMDKRDPVQGARSRIVIQACNDFLDVFIDSVSGRGRSAIRGSRSLYEHAVNHRWVSSRPEEAQRYLRHVAIGERLDLLFDTPTEAHFEGKQRKRFRHWYEKRSAMVNRSYESAVSEYGPAFKSKWTQRSLFDRATEVGLGTDDYERYRLLSAVIHGTAAGDLWQRREMEGVPVLRVGPSPAVSPLALSLGVRYFSTTLEDVAAAVGSDGTTRMLAALDRVEACLPEFRTLCMEIDDDIWPEGPVRTELIYVLHPDGRREWWLRDAEVDKVIRANPVGFTAEYAALVETRVDEVESVNPRRKSPVLIRVAGDGAPWVKARWADQFSVFPHMRPGFWDPGNGRRALRVREVQHDPSL